MSLAARVALPLTGELRCSACQCRLRQSRGVLLVQLLSAAAWLWGLASMATAVLLRSPPVFVLGMAGWIALEILIPLELDARDAPSVRRAQRFGPH